MSIVDGETKFRALEERGFRLDIAAVEPTTPRQSVRIESSREVGSELTAIADQNIEVPPASEVVLRSMIAAARRDLERYPSSHRARVNLGAALLNGQMINEAIQLLQEAARAMPGDRPTTSLLARAYVAGGRAEEAERIYELLRAKDPADEMALAGLAEASMRRRDYASADKQWAAVCRLRPDSTPAHYNRGLTLLVLGPDHARAAIKELRFAARMDPRRPAFHQGLGVGYALAGDRDRAAISFRTALHLDPSMSEALGGLVKVLVDAGRTREALEAASRHLVSMPAGLRPLEILAWASVTCGNIPAARAELFKAFRLLQEQRPQSPRDIGRVANNLGVCSALERDWVEARRYFERSVSAAPTDSATPYANLATAHLQLQQRAHSRNVLQKASKLFPDSDRVVVLLARGMVIEGKHEDALAVLREWMDAGNSSPKVYSFLGVELADEFGRIDEGLTVLLEGRRRFPSDNLLINNVAYAQLMAGHTSAAAETLADVGQPDSETDIYLTATRGLLRIRQGLADEGIALYKEAARKAAESGRPDVVSHAIQKMHLEIARFNIAQGRTGEGLAEIDLGLSIEPGRPSFVRDLEDLRARARS